MRARPLRIVITADPYLPVPPRLYGGIERIVDLLIRGLAARGHHLTLVAHPESQTPAEVVPYGIPPHEGRWARAGELAQLAKVLWGRRHAVDVVHSFGRLASLLPLLSRRALPKIQSYQRDVSWRGVRIAARLARGSLCFVGCSESQIRARPAGSGTWRRIWNGVDMDRYRHSPAVPSDAPLVFLGRIEPIKGAHHAVEIARAAGRRLIFAGNVPDQARDYFAQKIAPYLDEDRVRWVGPVDDVQKIELLGSAAAMVFPVEIEEPFGIVMAEALACGTPVIAFARGAAPEVVLHGKNGFLCRDAGEAARAVAQLATIDRAEVRRDCEARFSAAVIVDQYEQLYREMVERCGAS